ncbi:hypothetical protein V8E52_011120, partial [Russula decolorans]
MRDGQLWNLLERSYLLYAENLASRHHHPKSIMLIFRHHFVSRTLALRPRQKDPWSSMPHSPEHIASTTSPANTPPPNPLPRPGESIETTRARVS